MYFLAATNTASENLPDKLWIRGQQLNTSQTGKIFSDLVWFWSSLHLISSTIKITTQPCS